MTGWNFHRHLKATEIQSPCTALSWRLAKACRQGCAQRLWKSLSRASSSHGSPCCITYQFVAVWYQSMFTSIPQGYYTGTGAIVGLPQCQWSNPEESIGKCIISYETTGTNDITTYTTKLCVYCMGLLYFCATPSTTVKPLTQVAS